MRVLVCEPHDEVRALLVHVIERLGHESVCPVACDRGAVSADDVDIVLLDPVDSGAVATTESLLRHNGGLPVVCASIYPDSGQAACLRPVAYLVKPFGLAELEQALTAAVESAARPPLSD